MKSTLIKHGFLAGTLLGLPLVTYAYDLPTVNLGMTSFLDGGLPAGPGWYAQTYFQNYDSNKLVDAKGQKLGLPKTDLNYQVLVEQISYLSNVRVKDKASLGINFLIPFVSKMDMDDGLNNVAIKAQSGFGDIMIGPFIQFDPVIGAQGPKFVHRFEFQVNLPTGEYNQQKILTQVITPFHLTLIGLPHIGLIQNGQLQRVSIISITLKMMTQAMPLLEQMICRQGKQSMQILQQTMLLPNSSV